MALDLTFSALQDANERRNREWDPESKLGALFWTTELAGEVGEACNIVKKLEREALGLRGSRASKEDLAAELGDIAICLCLVANHFDIDLGYETKKKFNASSEKLGLAVRL